MPPVSDPQLVEFIRAHQHRGVEYARGDTLRVDPRTRELLQRFGAIA